MLVVSRFILKKESRVRLPALKSLGELSERERIIVIDRREQSPLEAFQRLQTVPRTLTTGDYSVAGLEHLFSVERKTTFNPILAQRPIWRDVPVERLPGNSQFAA